MTSRYLCAKYLVMDDVDRILDQWRHARPDLDTSAMGPVGRLARIAHHNARRMAENFAKHGVTAAGFDVLATLRRTPPPHSLSPGELMASMMITSGTMTHRLDQLEKEGLISRCTDSKDARRARVTLTPLGFEKVEGALVDHCATQKSLFESLSPHEIEVLNGLLRKLLAGHET